MRMNEAPRIEVYLLPSAVLIARDGAASRDRSAAGRTGARERHFRRDRHAPPKPAIRNHPLERAR